MQPAYSLWWKMPIVVECLTSDGQVVDYYGPFVDEAWAQAWIRQHNHDPHDGIPENEDAPEERLDDPDHWCYEYGDCSHRTYCLAEPGFDPTTLPGPVDENLKGR